MALPIGRRPSNTQGHARRPMVSSQWRELASAVVSSTLIVALLLISVIGIPWGIRQLMRFALIYGDRVAAYADSTNEDIQPSLDSSKGT